MSFNLTASLRRLKPQKQTGPLRRRDDGDLPFVSKTSGIGRPLLLDTTVYIDALRKRLPVEVENLMHARQVNHSGVALSELVYSIGRLEPGHPKTSDAIKTIRRAIENVPPHRVVMPTAQSMLDAGLLTGIAARLLKLPSTDNQSLLNDSLLFVQAMQQGCCLLSRNVVDFDRLLQLVPDGRVLLYRQQNAAGSEAAPA